MAAVRRELKKYDLDNVYIVDEIENGDVGEAGTGSRMNHNGNNTMVSDAEIVDIQSPQQPKRVVPYAHVAELIGKLEAPK